MIILYLCILFIPEHIYNSFNLRPSTAVELCKFLDWGQFVSKSKQQSLLGPQGSSWIYSILKDLGQFQGEAKNEEKI